MKELEALKPRVEALLQNDNWIIWKHFGVPDQEGDKREQIRNLLALFFHCKKCTGLSGCCFVLDKMPKYPLHDRCDCDYNFIHGVDNGKAYCDIRKFTEYIFTDAEKSKGKLDKFLNWGYSIFDSEYLKTEIEKQAFESYSCGDYVLGELNDYGQRITIIITLHTRIGVKNFKSGWMVHPLGKITCNTPYSGDVK